MTGTTWRLSWSGALGISLLAATGCRSTAGPSGEQTTVHVAPSGDDRHPGTRARPVRSIAAAQVVARRRIAAGLRGPLTVSIAAGTYELAAPLEFDSTDSGSERFPVTYAAAPGATVVVSGGRRLTGWRRDPAGRWVARLPEGGRRSFRQLTVGGQRATRARWPDQDGVLRIAAVTDGVCRLVLDRPLPARLGAGEATELVVYENWSITRGLVVAAEQRVVQVATPMGWIGHGPATTASPGKPAFLEHARAFLDQPGEWFQDLEAGTVTYLPRPGEDPNRHTVVTVPALPGLVRIVGNRAAPVRHLHFRGLRFEHTGFPLPEFGYREIQAAHYGTRIQDRTFVQPVAIQLAHAEDCRFERCRLAHIGASGVGFGPGCRRNAVVGCEIEDIGGTGILVGWRGQGELRGGREGLLDADWADPADAPSHTAILDNRIRRCGADSSGAVGVFVAFAADTRVAHNLVHDLPYTGISVGYRWNTTATSQVRCVVENNHIHDVMRKLADGGGIYTLGFQPGTVLRGNYIHDVHRSRFAHGGAPNNGFFVDEGSKGFLFEANVVHDTAGQPVRFNNCRREWHRWQGNCFGGPAAAGSAALAVRRRAGPRPPYR